MRFSYKMLAFGFQNKSRLRLTDDKDDVIAKIMLGGIKTSRGGGCGGKLTCSETRGVV